MSIETLQHLEREIARLYALQADALVAVASAGPVVDEFALLDPESDDERRIRIEDAVREEVAAALRWSPSTAQSRIEQARLLADPLDQVRDALLAGEVSPRHVGVIVDAAGGCRGRLIGSGAAAMGSRTPARSERRRSSVRHAPNCSDGCCPRRVVRRWRGPGRRPAWDIHFLSTS